MSGERDEEMVVPELTWYDTNEFGTRSTASCATTK